MSEISLTLVLPIKTSKIINDMAKVQQKSEKICAFGGIFFVLDKFDRILSSVIDSHLGLRSKLIGYQYSEITRAVEAINGEGKALDTKQKWAGVYRLLRWQCNFPVRGSEFCERINRLKC